MNLDNVQDVFILSAMQQGMLFHTISDPESGAFIEQICCDLEGEPDVSGFETSWAQVTRHYDSLRTMFLWEGLDEPLQVIRQQVDVDWHHLDWTELPAAVQRKELSDFLSADRARGFDLTQAPLMRMTLIRTEVDRWKWVWSFHHILFDGWSTSIILRDFFATCVALHRERESPLQPPFPYRNYIEWLTRQDAAQAETFWRNQLRGFSIPTRVQTPAFAESAPATGHHQCHRTLSRSLSESLRDFARDQRLTLNTVVHGAWALLLSRLASEADVVYGATMAGRPHDLTGIEDAVGLFINTLPVRVNASGHSTLADWLAEIQGKLLRIREYEYTPLAKTQAWSDIPPGQTLFDSIVVFENYPTLPQTETDAAGFKIQGFEYFEQSNYPLALLVAPADDMQLIIVHDADYFCQEAAVWILERLEILFTTFVQSPHIPVDQISLLNTQERKRALSRLKDSSEVPEFDLCIHSLFEQQVQRRPDATAVVFNSQHLTYDQLDRRSAELAVCLQSHGVGPDVTVGLCVERGVEMIVGIFSILKAGGAYVPLDPRSPDAQIRFIVGDADVSVILTQLEQVERVPKTEAVIVVIDAVDHSFAGSSDSPLNNVTSRNLAYLIYTSGSTGAPKGVEITHKNLVLSTIGRCDHYAESPDRFLLLSSYSFDSSVAGIFWTLCTGGTLVLPAPRLEHNVIALADLINEQHVTHSLCLPSLYELLLDHSAADRLASLKTLIVAGESCPSRVAKKHFARVPNAELHNEYGPTEATVWSTVQKIDVHDTEPISIGRAVPHTTVCVLDKNQQLVPTGLPGEICITGPKLAKGYRNQPKLTANAFVPNPFSNNSGSDSELVLYRTGDRGQQRADGSLIFLGRMDNQLKVNGHRVEVEAIEAALLSYPVIREVVVGEAVPDMRPAVTADVDSLVAALDSLSPADAKALLQKAESHSAPGEDSTQPSLSVSHTDQGVVVSFDMPGKDFIATPRPGQRKWLLDQALHEAANDIQYLSKLAPRFVPGSDDHDAPQDYQAGKLTAREIMEDWQYPLMKAMAEYATESHGDLLEIGFGRGVSANMLQDFGVRSHTIIEANPYSVSDHYEPWKKTFPNRDIRMIEGRWQDVPDQLGVYDSIFFHAFPLNLTEFVEYIANSVTFAEHFFPTAAKLLRPGGVFTYLTTEIDSLSRRHQRALFRYFDEIQMKVQPITVPPDTKDAWWADSMVVLRATVSGSARRQR